MGEKAAKRGTMALRIAGPPSAAPELPADIQEPMPEGEPYPPEELVEEPAIEPATGGTLDPAVAGYRDPEAGPFVCSNCVHFSVSGPNTCEHVSGFIDENALCNLFTPMDKSEEALEEPAMELATEELEEELPEGL